MILYRICDDDISDDGCTNRDLITAMALAAGARAREVKQIGKYKAGIKSIIQSKKYLGHAGRWSSTTFVVVEVGDWLGCCPKELSKGKGEELDFVRGFLRKNRHAKRAAILAELNEVSHSEWLRILIGRAVGVLGFSFFIEMSTFRDCYNYYMIGVVQ